MNQNIQSLKKEIKINLLPYLINSIEKSKNEDNHSKDKKSNIDYLIALKISMNNPIKTKLTSLPPKNKSEKNEKEIIQTTPKSQIQFTYFESPKLEKTQNLSNNTNNNLNNIMADNQNTETLIKTDLNKIFYGQTSAFQNPYQNINGQFQTRQINNLNKRQNYSNLEKTIQNQNFINPSILDLKYHGLEPILGRNYYSTKRF